VHLSMRSISRRLSRQLLLIWKNILRLPFFISIISVRYLQVKRTRGGYECQNKVSKRAQEFVYSLGLPSVRDVLVMLRKGHILNCPVVHDDVKWALVISKPSLGHLKGTTRYQNAPVIDLEEIKRREYSIVCKIYFIYNFDKETNRCDYGNPSWKRSRRNQ